MMAVAVLVLGNSSLQMSNSHSAQEEHVPRRGFEASLQPSWQHLVARAYGRNVKARGRRRIPMGMTIHTGGVSPLA